MPDQAPATIRQLVDAKEVMERLQITDRRTITKLIEDEGLPVIRIGRLRRFDPAAVEAWIDSRWTQPTAGEAA